MIIPWRRGASSEHTFDDALSALTAADWMDDRLPVLWAYWPIDVANPYQSLIYSRFAEHNLIPVPVHNIKTLERLLNFLPPQTRVVLHIHWLYRITAGAQTADEADDRADQFDGLLLRLIGRGTRLVWSVHNVLPHEAAFADSEIRLRRSIAARVDLVHLMHKSHLKIVSETLGIDHHRTAVFPHPTYVGAYPIWVDRRAARTQLGIPLGARVLLTFGQIRGYKGHEQFLNVFDLAAREDPDLLWLVVGKLRDEPGIDRFAQLAANHPSVLLVPRFVSSDEVQYFLQAADSAVLPYLHSLNSGAAALIAGHGLPAFASSAADLADLLPPQAVRRFSPFDQADAAHVVARGRNIECDHVRDSIRQHTASLHSGLVSEAMARAMRAWIDG